MMDAARPEASLRDFEAAALAKQHVLLGHAHIGEAQLAMAVRRVEVAEHRQHALLFDAGRIHWHQDHGLLLVRVRVVRVRLPHQDQDLAALVAGARGPPFAAVDNVIAAVLLDGNRNVRGVGGGHIRLGHGEARADFAGQQRLQPALLLRLAAIADQHLHVARVRRGAVEHLRPPMRAAHDLRKRRVFEIG